MPGEFSVRLYWSTSIPRAMFLSCRSSRTCCLASCSRHSCSNDSSIFCCSFCLILLISSISCGTEVIVISKPMYNHMGLYECSQGRTHTLWSWCSTSSWTRSISCRPSRVVRFSIQTSRGTSFSWSDVSVKSLASFKSAIWAKQKPKYYMTNQNQ